MSLIADMAEQYGRLSAEDQAKWNRPTSELFNGASYQIEIPQRYLKLWESFKTLVPKKYSDGNDVRKEFISLVEAYSEPHRRHHTLSHIEDMVSQYNYYKEKLDKDAKAVLAAIFYHDIVYNCQHGEDEKQSANVADISLGALEINQRTIKRAISMIHATATHTAKDGDFATQLFLDMDMSVLASRSDIYAHYVSHIRHEYCVKLDIAESVFNQARADRFLQPLLVSGQPIFRTEEYAHLNAIAIINLRRELESYKASVNSVVKPHQHQRNLF